MSSATASTDPVPDSISAYLKALKACLKGQPAALILDALADAEEYLRSEQAASPGEAEADLLRRIVETYGSPQEVAQEYLAMEKAVDSPFPAPTDTGADSDRHPGLFGILVDPRAYGALIYMMLSLATGVFYFTWAVTGVSLSLGLSILIIGLPFALLFIGSVRVISWVEGRVVETLLGVRMPRRRPSTDAEGTVWARIGRMLSDGRTWGSLFYMLLLLPLGSIYFTLAVALGATAGGLIASGIYLLASGGDVAGSGIVIVQTTDFPNVAPELISLLNSPPGQALAVLLGLLGVLLTLHLARAIGTVHGKIAEVLLVRS